ncbi:MAG: EAL domain-containing protein [Pseudomonadota bacterium]
MSPLAPTLHLLITDDDALLRSMAMETLRHAGFEVTGAASGEEALQQFAARTFDLVVLDLVMPGIDGYEVCQRIRATPQGARIPILILTGLDDTGSIDLAYQHGATDFITKPINWTLLSHRVRYALRASAAGEAIRHSRESLARALSLAGMGNWAMYPDGRLECSTELLRLFGTTAEAGVCNSVADFAQRVVDADRERVTGARDGLMRGGLPYQLQFQILRFDGELRTVFEQATTVLNDQGRTLSVEGITQDITERVRAEEHIRQLVHYDVITGVPNRQFFSVIAAPPLERARRNGTSCALFHVDIDRFKGVNDAFGRGSGDAVLKTIAERLRTWSRSSDFSSARHERMEDGMLARVGSNAFTLLTTDLGGQQQASQSAQQLLKVVAQPIPVDGQSLVLTASIGIAFYPDDAQDLAGLSRCAEQAAYAAKSAGRAQHRFFDEQLNAHAASRISLEAELRTGIARNELRLHYQPKVDVNNGTIVGAEALVRWQHPSRGLLPPAAFIELAEETGLILPLTDWVLETACVSLRDWARKGLRPIPLSVNLAASSLADVTLLNKLDALMQRYGLSPSSLLLEMTETMWVRDVESGIVLLQGLHERGYGLSLDDFGTGYSSLSYLNRFPIDELKIDRSFVTNAANGRRDGALAAAIITLGRELGLQVIAEGVETVAQSEFLRKRGCNLQQGFLFAKPMAGPDFEVALRQSQLPPRPRATTA